MCKTQNCLGKLQCLDGHFFYMLFLFISFYPFCFSSAFPILSKEYSSLKAIIVFCTLILYMMKHSLYSMHKCIKQNMSVFVFDEKSVNVSGLISWWEVRYKHLIMRLLGLWNYDCSLHSFWPEWTLYQHTSYFMLNEMEFAAPPSSIEAVLCKTGPGSMEALMCLYTALSLLYGPTWWLCMPR